jgi:RHH-type proline utilization regulon transcriptional repressor/proline dehydrogenase/delta 1-pyrroline-5-carboxylate dehydrogenase
MTSSKTRAAQPLTDARDAPRARISAMHLADEPALAATLIEKARLSPEEVKKTQALARRLVVAVRKGRRPAGGLDAFLQEYKLTSDEGVVLLCLAEALLRIPDAETRDRLIRDKLSEGDWAAHLGHSQSLVVNASTFGLLLTGGVVRLEDEPGNIFGRLVAKSGEPLIRQAVLYAVRILARQFVRGRTIEEALKRAHDEGQARYRYSYDMLGEAARTAADAERYCKAYAHAIDAIAADESARGQSEFAAPGISVKLSALHPRFVSSQRERVMREAVPRLAALCAQAKAKGLALTIDAEEADRLELSLDVFEAMAKAKELSGWNGLGLAVQAYQKRALPMIDWLAALARQTGRRIPLRLVKGAYWDSEIKRAQERGLPDYPVFTLKQATDVSYLACIKALLAAPKLFYPQFATHNALTLAQVLVLAGAARDFEFQRLHGMGEALYAEALGDPSLGIECRIYAPVGGHEDLLAYLVRRLLENGANTSFVNRLADDEAPVSTLVADPVALLVRSRPKRHGRIPPPPELFGRERRNSLGLAFDNPDTLSALSRAMSEALAEPARAMPLVGGKPSSGTARAITDPANLGRVVGEAVSAGDEQVELALAAAYATASQWDRLGGDARGKILERAADLFVASRARLMALVVREAGRIVPDALSELRESVDLLRYYATRARAELEAPLELPGPAGERNLLALRGRGVFACISPWNFPLSIFTGQAAAALAAGNAVIAKPAEQTPLVAYEAVRLLHKAGVPAQALHFLPGAGERVGAKLVRDPRIAGVAFTGSTETAQAINLALASRVGPIVPFIAETGGLNAMIVDSTALIEQVVDDALASAFDSAGQRCSSARLLFLQDDIADKTIKMLSGALEELRVGDPMEIETDIGPIIDEAAREALEAHTRRMLSEGKLIAAAKLPPETSAGIFFAPMLFEIERASLLTREVFGPILHVVRFARGALGKVCEAVNATGYGLTLGLHTRIDAVADEVFARVRVGNIYVNRSQIGAVVGMQPFGGEGLSGTGPKAGGPHYLRRFATERALSINTAAAGGNAALFALD